MVVLRLSTFPPNLAWPLLAHFLVATLFLRHLALVANLFPEVVDVEQLVIGFADGSRLEALGRDFHFGLDLVFKALLASALPEHQINFK